MASSTSQAYPDGPQLTKPPVARRTTHYTCLDALGKGTYGICYKVVHNGGGSPCVMKVVPLSGLSSKDIKAAFLEAMLLRTVKHPHVVGYHDAWVENSHLYIVMEYCSEGDLAQLLKAHHLPAQDIWGFARDICCGLEHLHKNKIMHRDIKPSNLFLSNRKVIIGDLGLGRHLEQHSLAETQVGTPLYSAPEVCSGMPYTFSADVWAFGCVLYEMVARAPPYVACSQAALAEKICGSPPPALPQSCPQPLQRIILSTLQKAPSKRPSMLQCLNFVSALPIASSTMLPAPWECTTPGLLTMDSPGPYSSGILSCPNAAAVEQSTCQMLPPGPQSTNESPPLDAVQVIVKRLEAQATPGQVSSTAGTLPDPIHTVSPTRPKHSAGACCNAGGLQSTLDAAATTQAERLTNPCTTREAVAAPSHTVARSPPRSVNACSDGVARNDSSSCVGCREAQHELKTLTCKVAGLQRLLASANQRAHDEKRSNDVLRRQHIRLQDALLTSRVPGAQWLVGSPPRSPAADTADASPRATAASVPAATLEHTPALPRPERQQPASSPPPQPARMEQFQAACAALVLGTSHADSASTSSPLVLCATTASHPLSAPGQRHPCPAPEARHGKASQVQTPTSRAVTFADAFRRGPPSGAPAVPAEGTGEVPGGPPAVGGAARPHTQRLPERAAVQLHTPRQQHARAHVPTPVDVQKLLRAEATPLPWRRLAGECGAQGHPPHGAGQHMDAHAGLLGTHGVSQMEPARGGRNEQRPGGHQSPRPHGSQVHGTKQAVLTARGKSGAAALGCEPHGTGYVSQYGRAPAATGIPRRGHNRPAGNLEEKQTPGAFGTSSVTPRQGVSGGSGSHAGHSRAVPPHTGNERGRSRPPAGRLGVEACIPPGRQGGSIPTELQMEQMQRLLRDPESAGVSIGGNPGSVSARAPAVQQSGGAQRDADGGLQEECHATAAVQSLCLWAGQHAATRAVSGTGADAVVSEQENIAPEDKLPSRHEAPPWWRPGGPSVVYGARGHLHTPAGQMRDLQPAGPSHTVAPAHADQSQREEDHLEPSGEGAPAPPTPSGRSRAAASYTATPISPRTPRTPAARRGAVAPLAAPQMHEVATPRGAARNGGTAVPLSAPAAMGPAPRAARYGSSPSVMPRMAAGPVAVPLAEMTPGRPQNVTVAGSLLRTPPTMKARAHTAAVAGELAVARSKALVPEHRRHRLNEAFRRTSALLQRCKESGGGVRGTSAGPVQPDPTES